MFYFFLMPLWLNSSRADNRPEDAEREGGRTDDGPEDEGVERKEEGDWHPLDIVGSHTQTQTHAFFLLFRLLRFLFSKIFFSLKGE